MGFVFGGLGFSSPLSTKHRTIAALWLWANCCKCVCDAHRDLDLLRSHATVTTTYDRRGYGYDNDVLAQVDSG